MRRLVLVVVVAACGGSDGPSKVPDAQTGPKDAMVDMATPDAKVWMDASVVVDATLDAAIPDGPIGTDAGVVCNPLTQTGCNSGEKCTWLLDALTPTYAGHIGCAPAGTAMVGQACMYGAPGATGYDNCIAGLVCGNYQGGAGVCKQICDNQGGSPQCNAQSACVTYSNLFTTGSTTPQAAGVCDATCDPLADNDFDGSGALTKTGTFCSTTNTGCYGYPSLGTFPPTAWTCASDINSMTAQPTGFRHRVQCTSGNGCAPNGTLYVNSCNQGYLPLLRESTMNTTVICVALCKPQNCYMGSCGANNDNRLGMSPHRCNTSDRVGTFDTSAAAEHCAYLWYLELDTNGNYLPSPTSNAVGFCYDHSKYLYDSNGDNIADAPLPACAQLQNGMGSGTNPMDPLTYFGAGDLGCVDTTNAGVMFTGKPRAPRALSVRALYHPASSTP